MRKLRRADELAAEGRNGEEIAAEMGVSPATLYNWRRTYGGMERLACRAVGLARSTYRHLPVFQKPADPDAEMRACLRGYAK